MENERKWLSKTIKKNVDGHETITQIIEQFMVGKRGDWFLVA